MTPARPDPLIEVLRVDVPAPNAGYIRTRTFMHLLDHVVDRKNGRLVDLGAGHCLFARLARDRGYEVTAVDGRAARVPPPEELGSIRFVEADVRTVDIGGYDVILCLGLLYHFAIEDQIALLRRANYGAAVIVETEVHDPDLIASADPPAWQTAMVREGPYEGVVYPEIENDMASIGNSTSFWHTAESWLRLFAECGFNDIQVIEPRFQSKYGGRQFFVLRPSLTPRRPRPRPEQRVKRVLLTGTSNLRNYGDLLFPIVARRRLELLGLEVVPVSPVGLDPGWADTAPPRGFAGWLDSGEEFDAVLIGGGDVVHVEPANLADYSLDGLDQRAYAELWFGATLAGVTRGVPIVWNAPGVPRPLPDSLHGSDLLARALRAASYVSVRDAASLRNLGQAAGKSVAVVPDTAAEIARIWPRESLAAAFAELLERKRAPTEKPFLTVHVGARSLDGPPDRLAAMIEAFATTHGLTPLLLALGPVHGDDATAREVGRFIRGSHVVVADPLGLREIAAAISHSTLHLGSALHGYITSAAYGVRSVLVANPSQAKFGGFVEHTGRRLDCAPDWDSGLSRAGELLREARPAGLPARVIAALDRHWDRVAIALIMRPDDARAASFLRGYVASGIASRGWGWATAPCLDPSPGTR